MTREALVVGINRYPLLKDKPTSKPRHLLKPAADAEAIAQFLENYGNFRVQRLPTINIDGSWRVDAEPAPRNLIQVQDLKKAIANLFHPPSSSIPDTALLFFAGHGLRSNEGGVTEGFLATSEANPQRGKWGLSLQWLRQLLQESPVRQQIIWLDCCHSGELLNFAEANPGSKGKARDRCLIAASRDFEVAYEEVGGEHGVLTGALLQALNPKNYTESWVTNYSLVDYINKQLATSRQRPIFHNSGGEIILTGEKEKIERAVLMAGVCPYKGLQAFDFNEEDPKYFKGRTVLTDSLLDKVREGNFLAVMGASGSGKSSVVKAGLLYQLKLGQKISGSENWPILIFRPGEHPLKSLARVFVESAPLTPQSWGEQNPNVPSNISPQNWGDGGAIPSPNNNPTQQKKAEELIATNAIGLTELVKATLQETSETRFLQETGFLSRRVVLVIDQFEECFTLCHDNIQRQNFFKYILGALEKTENKLCLIITMRADFFGKCAEQEYGGLARKIQENLVTVTPMNREELEEAITEPARIVGLEMQRELVEQIIADVEGSPGILPLLQYTLTELWRRREMNLLTLAQYTKIGGVKGTLQNRANEVYNSLSEDEKLTAKRIFLELTQLGEGTEDTRRQILKSGLISEKHPQARVDAVLDKLTSDQARLLVTSELQARGQTNKNETVVDVTHEALIRHWDKLREWVNEYRPVIRIERKIEAEAEDWQRKGKPKGDLLFGSRLAEAENYLKDYEQLGLLESLAKEFIDKSIKKRRNNRLIIIFIGTGAIGFTLLLWQRGNTNAFLMTMSKLGEKAAKVANLLTIDPVNALVTAIATTGESEDKLQQVLPTVQSSLISAIQVPQERNIFKGNQSAILSIAVSADGQYIVSGSDDKTVRLWDMKGNPIGQPFQGHQDFVTSVAFSPDGQYIVSGSVDKTVRLWDKKGNPIGQPFQEHQAAVIAVAFSPDSQYIISGSSDKTVRLWDKQGNPIGQPFQGHEREVTSVAFSPDGQYIVSGSWDKTVRLWDLKGKQIGQPFQGHEREVTSVAFSPNGQYIVSGSYDWKVRLWDIKGNPIGQPFQGHQDAVISVAFSPDNKNIVSSSRDNSIRLWDIKGNSIGQPLQGHRNFVTSVTFSPDGKYILSGSRDKTIRLWDMKANPIGQSFPETHTEALTSVAVSPDGQYIVSGSADKTVRLWDIKGNPIGQPFLGHQGWVNSVAFSPDSQYIATGGGDETVRLWDIKGKAIGLFRGDQGYVNAVAFSPDSKYIVSGNGRNTVQLWDIKGNPIGQPFQGHQDGVTSVAFSPDGQYIVSGSWDKTVRLWDIKGNPIGQPFKGHEDYVKSVVFSPDGKYIISGSDDNTLRLWDLKGNLISQPFQGHRNYVTSVAFSPDGKYIISGSRDNTMRLWDIKGNPIGQPFQGHQDYINAVAFSPDGKYIVSGSRDNTMRLWQGGNWQSWLSEGCNRLREHSVLVHPETEEAKSAAQTCQKYVWK